jgi:hypothetical protein
MKTSILSVFALTISAALAIPVEAGGRTGGGGHFTGGYSAGARPAPGRGGPGSSFRPMRNFGGNRTIYSPSSAAFRPRSITSNGSVFTGAGQFPPANSNRVMRPSNQRNQALANASRNGNIAGPAHRGNSLPPNWRNHVFAQHSVNWHRDWDRGHEHWWHGHRCRFVDGSWFIFDFGFYPWWSYGYPGYYAYDYYPYGYAPGGYYDPGVYEGEEYSDQNSYESPDQNADSIVAAAQEQLSREGYYRGAIDAVIGPETRRAIARYQSNHGLRVTGYLTTETVQALGVGNLATN